MEGRIVRKEIMKPLTDFDGTFMFATVSVRNVARGEPTRTLTPTHTHTCVHVHTHISTRAFSPLDLVV